MKDINFLFKLKGIIDSRYSLPTTRFHQIKELVMEKLYPTEYEGERRYTEAFIRLMNGLMADHGLTEEQAYEYLSLYNDPEQCDTDSAIEALERHAARFKKLEVPFG